MVLLVGEQPAPNLLPVRHYKPRGVILVYSDFTARIAGNLQEVLQTRLCIKCQVPAYDIKRVREVLTGVLEKHGWQGHDLVFNLTGGTKLMMLAAYSVAQEMGSRCLYLVSEKGQSEVHRFGFKGGSFVRMPPERIATTITLDDHLRVYVGGYRSQAPRDEFERAVVEKLRPRSSPIEEIVTDVRPLATSGLEIDALVRIGNQVGVLEIKKRADKRGIDQLTTAASREYLGTYVRKFLIAANKVGPPTERLARAHGIQIIELLSYGRAGRLTADDTSKLRLSIQQAMAG